MKNNKIIPSILTAGCLLFSGLTFASSEPPRPDVSEKATLTQYSPVPEQVTTSTLLRQILAEVMKGNLQKEDNRRNVIQKTNNRCSDGEKQYSPGYVISTGKKTLRCVVSNGYPEWVEDRA